MSLLIQLLAAVALFFFSNWIGKNSLHLGYTSLSFNQPFNDSPAFNLVYRVFAPVAFITLLAALFYWLKKDEYVTDIYRIVIFYFILRYLFFIVTERLILLSHWQFFFIAVLSIACSMAAYDQIISKKQFFFPAAQELGSALWLGVVAFLYQTLNSITTSDRAQRKRVRKYVLDQYMRLKHRHGRVVDEYSGSVDNNLIYSIMIFESLNRPRLFALAERAKLHVTGKASIGPMQIYTEQPLTQNDSIRKGIEKLKHSLALHSRATEQSPDELMSAVLNDYNPSYLYATEVREIMDVISDKGEV